MAEKGFKSGPISIEPGVGGSVLINKVVSRHLKMAAAGNE